MLPQDDPTQRLLTEANAAERYANKAIDRKSTDFDFTAVSPAFHTTLNLADTTIMQSFTINETTREIYATQVATVNPDPSQSFVLTRMTIEGIRLDSMRLNHAGHGTSIGVENAADGVYIWSNYYQLDAGGNVIGTDLVRFKYVGGAVYDEKSPALIRYNKFTTDYVCPVIDEKNGTIVFRRSNAGVDIIELRNLADVKAGTNKILRSMTIPTVGDPAISYLQGFTVDGDSLYWVTGDTNSTTYPHEITRFNMVTGLIEKRETLTFGYGPGGIYEDGFREPEGAYLYTDPVTGAKTLFAGVVTGEGYRRIAKVYAFHSLGNESKFIANKTQLMQGFKLTENSGRAKKLPYGVTALSTVRDPGSYYLSSADSATLTDHPLPGVSDWFVEIGGRDAAGACWQILRRNSAATANLRTYYRTVTSAGAASVWVMLSTGAPTWAPITTTPAAIGTAPQATLIRNGQAVALSGYFNVPGTYTSGMNVGIIPDGYRPSASRRLMVGIDDGAGGTCMLFINSAGDMKLYSNPGVAKNILLDGITYYL